MGLPESLIASSPPLREALPTRKSEAEGGCGVIGLAASVPVAGRHLLRALVQMKNRGNGKGGGIAAAGLDPTFFGVSQEVLERNYLLAVAYLDGAAQAEVEDSLEATFLLEHVLSLPTLPDPRALGLGAPPPVVRCYFARVRPEVRARFMQAHGITEEAAAEDELVYQHSYRLNRAFYASEGEKRAFVLSHSKNLLILKLVGYGDDVVRYYRLEDLRAQVWIGHHRYPTKGKVWHPGGAHPFLGMHEALVHNGDFANYASMVSYLAQRRIYPLFLTDTEVAALLFDLYHRVYGYPMEYVIEALAPTTERDFTLLPPQKQHIYRMLQAVHLHGSPDGPWFFLIAQSLPRERAFRLIGITDTSMLRPQVFALQQGVAGIGLVASEKQAIDAALESLAQEDRRFWPHADRYWSARGGSHTDGGAFIFTVGRGSFRCTDKFGRPIQADPLKQPPLPWPPVVRRAHPPELPPAELYAWFVRNLPGWGYGDLEAHLDELVRGAACDQERQRALQTLTLLLDRHYPTGSLKPSAVRWLLEQALSQFLEQVCRTPSSGFRWLGQGAPVPEPEPECTLLLDARGYPSEGVGSLARTLVELYQRGFRRFLLAHMRGQRFVGCGLGAASHGVRIDVYGSAGDYLGSGLDGAEITVHASGQDQLAQILKDGRLVVHGDVGQTFMYAAKGGEAYVLGNAAGRPLINAVGSPRVVINGTALDYLAESFMAGDPLQGGGFVILNGVYFDEDGSLRDLDTPYPGGNLFSLASGGALYVRDPHRKLSEEQLNGGELAPLGRADWELIRPYLEHNERLFGIPLSRLLDGREPDEVYRKVQPAGHQALLPEEAWVRKEA